MARRIETDDDLADLGEHFDVVTQAFNQGHAKNKAFRCDSYEDIKRERMVRLWSDIQGDVRLAWNE